MCIKKLENKHRNQMDAALKRQAAQLEEECKLKLNDSGYKCGEGTAQLHNVVLTLMKHFDKCFDVIPCQKLFTNVYLNIGIQGLL